MSVGLILHVWLELAVGLGLGVTRIETGAGVWQ